MRIKLNAEFRRYDQEMRTGKAYDKDGNAIEGKTQEYMSRVLRLEVDGEGVIARLWEDQKIVIPESLKRGDLIEVEVMGFQTVKEATYLQISAIRPKK